MPKLSDAQEYVLRRLKFSDENRPLGRGLTSRILFSSISTMRALEKKGYVKGAHSRLSDPFPPMDIYWQITEAGKEALR